MGCIRIDTACLCLVPGCLDTEQPRLFNFDLRPETVIRTIEAREAERKEVTVWRTLNQVENKPAEAAQVTQKWLSKPTFRVAYPPSCLTRSPHLLVRCLRSYA